MTLQVKLSTLAISAEDFAARVQAHFERLVEYYHHLEGVKIDAANPDLKPEQRRVAFPPPSEDNTVELAIRRERHDDGSITPVIDYEVKGPTLTEKKAALTAKARELEAQAHHANVPAAKRRHFQLREADIHANDRARVEANPERVDNAFSFMAATRDPEDTTFLAEQAARHEKEQAIMRWGAKLEHDIEDLTEATIDAFMILPFHG